MTLTKSTLLIAVSALAVTGCTSDRFSRVDTRPAVVATAPAPITAAPAGQVSSSQLPPPTQPGVTNPGPIQPGMAQGAFPAAPGSEDGGTQVASLPPQGGGAPVSAGGVAGVWNAQVAGQSCRIATPQTRFGEGFRAGPLRCPAPLDGVRSWNVSGSTLTLYDANGSALANLSSAGSGSFNGQTSNGQPLSLTR